MQQQQAYQQGGTYSPMYFQQQQQQSQEHYRQQQQQLQDFYYSPFEQEYQQQQYAQYHQQLQEQQRHQRVDSVSSVSSAGSIGLAPLGWNLPGMAPPQVNEADLRQYAQQHHRRTSSTPYEDYQSSAGPSPSPSHISLVTDHSDSPVIPVAPLAVKKHGAAAGTQQATSKPPLVPDPDDYKVEVK
jgi:hypothetical protein